MIHKIKRTTWVFNIITFIQIFIQNAQKIRYMSASDIHITFSPFSSIPFLDPFSVFISTTYKYTQVTEKYQPDMGLYTCMLFISKSEVYFPVCHYFSKSNGRGSQIYYTYKQPDTCIIQFGVVQEIFFFHSVISIHSILASFAM